MSLSRLLLVPVLALLAACATQSTSQLTSVSRDPDMADRSYNKVFVMALASTEARRRMVEDAVVAKLKGEGVEALASWAYIDTLDLEDKAALRAAAEKAVKDSGADAALVGKVVREDKRTEYGPPQVEQTPVAVSPYFMGYGSYVGYGYQTVVSPGELREVHEYFLQTSLYDASTSQPVWRAQSVTLNPDNLEQAVADVADMLARRLLEDGVVNNAGMPRSSGGGY